MREYTIAGLEKLAKTLRCDVIEMLAQAKTGHSAASLGLADIMTALYFEILNHNPKNPRWEKRDRLCLSCGHAVPVRYAALARSGYFSKKWLKTLRQLGSKLQGHPSFIDLPALEHSSGPLGQGASVAVGMALAAKLDNKKIFIYCIVSDGEHDEGQLWEAVMTAAKYHLDNLIFIVDRNQIQIDGETEQIMPLEPLKEKYLAFNWTVEEVNGHNFEEILTVMARLKKITGQPKVMIANIVPGKGVSFMENDYEWHGLAPTAKQARVALQELNCAK